MWIKLLSLILVVSCAPSKDVSYEKPAPVSDEDLIDSRLKFARPRKNSVLILLPLSGRNRNVGVGILNACLLALDHSRSIDFYVMNTADTSLEKHAIYEFFRNKNLQAVIGPVFSGETKQYGALFPRVPVLSFSNNPTVNSPHVFACGLSLQDEIRALFSYAHEQDINSFTIMLPNSEIGNQILGVIDAEFKKYGFEEGDDFEIVRYTSISKEEATLCVKNSGKKAVFVISPILNMSELEDTTVFTLSSVALSNENVWNDAVFAFCDNREQQFFAQKYRAVFGTYPTILDMIAYDLMKVVKDSAGAGEPIVNRHYRGCFGDFTVNGKNGLVRKLQVFRSPIEK
jgi:ABC-type branched-subunit amino acid transport system substrate-binding protein